MAASRPCRIVRLHMRRAPCLTSTSPKTWTSTVTTINGTPHAQSAGHAQDAKTEKCSTDWAIPIESSHQPQKCQDAVLSRRGGATSASMPGANRSVRTGPGMTVTTDNEDDVIERLRH